MTPTSPRLPRYAGLDGLRAIAVALVLVYHLFPDAPLQGGFVGVDVFFVVSGFLITSLLLRPNRLGPGRRLLDFWRRRARRLLPALAAVLLVCSSAAWLVGGDVLVGIGRQLLGAATFSYNWVSMASGSDYFAATAPEMFRNVWSLAVEEQFYVLWPLLLPLVLLLPGRWTRVAVALVAAAGSAWWMSTLVVAEGATRAYFGTDSHAFGLLAGIALAFAAQRIPDAALLRHPVARTGGAIVGAAGLALIALAALRPETQDAATFPGTLLIASAGALLAVLAGVLPGSLFGRMLDVAPLRWVGDRSYGIYLWHWPVLVLAAAIADQGAGAHPWPVGAIALVVSVAAASASYRWLEQPLRRLGFRRALRAARARLAAGPARRVAAIGVAAGCVVMLGGTTAAIASAPSMTSSERAIREGQRALKKAAKKAEPTPVPAPDVVTGDEVTAVGDSVMLASAPALYQRMPGIAVDAQVSRSIWAGADLIDSLAASGSLREHVVVGLGTNGPVNQEVLAHIADTVGPERDLILVNAYAPRDWIDGVNRDLASFARTRTGVVVADWADAISPRTDLLAGDRIHPGSSGGEVFAEVVQQGIDDARGERSVRARLLTWKPGD